MRLISEKYRALKPTIEYLHDEVVIAQAWKKTHGYIRSFNWYADTLALDISALTLEENVKKWSKSIETEDLRPLELVPAIKSEAWVIDSKGWHPKEKTRNSDKVPLRPLAHITIRDQTWASTAMLCLADAVETVQGDCSHKNKSFEQAREAKVFSYGNRLICDWNSENIAWFRWGNSETYRKFFTDYQSFLKRPLELGKLAAEQVMGTEEVFVISLDLSKFYSNIDLDILIKRLKKISSNHWGENCESFWNVFSKITNWKWKEEDIKLSQELNLGDISRGLPQGLVAAGFFANAYLVDFDKAVGGEIGKILDNKKNIILHDYCRYVDDLRIVISAGDSNPKDIQSFINSFVGRFLKNHGGPSLSLNKKKTKVAYLSDLNNLGSLANRIDMIQSELSGPADRDVLDSVSGILENLISMDSFDVQELSTGHIDFDLLQLSDFDQDIRPDTIKRFAANRLENIVRSKRKIDNISESDTNNGGGYISDGNDELLAKKLITAWMKDPSLSLVLRKAIEIYPDSDLFEPVFNAIFERSSYGKKIASKNRVTEAAMDYLLADLFRCASDFNGYFQLVHYPINIRPSSVMDLLSKYAQKVLAVKKSSGFVRRQAMMLLAVTNKPVFIENTNGSIQENLHSILVNNVQEYQHQRSALFEVAAQISGDFNSYAISFLDSIVNLNDDEKYNALEVFAKRGGPFWISLWKYLNKKKSLKIIAKKLKWAAPLSSSQPRPQKQLLARVICSDQNGFEYEHALLKLALGLAKEAKNNPSVIGASPNEISVNLKPNISWDKCWEPSVDIAIHSIAKNEKVYDPRFIIPNWIDEKSIDNKVVYWIGSILRASALGGVDFTGSRWKESGAITYKGLRTSWYKRRMGMMHSPESLVGEFATTSDWFSDLLIRCLQWPGFESTKIQYEDVREIVDIKSFVCCISNRLHYLNGLICKSSSLPVLPTKVERLINEPNFRIVTVQPLLPSSDDFTYSDPKLNNKKYRAKHREHLLSISRLTLKTLEANAHANGRKLKPFADLIVFPEVSVHFEDQDIIKKLADTSGAIIFAGIVFTDHNGKLINIARWFIPDYRESGRQWVIRDQGKGNMTNFEIGLEIKSHRPCQHLIEIHGHSEGPFRLTGAICYDATDIKLASDLINLTDLFIVVAHNQDVSTFDNLAAALQYHMYQHVVIANTGEFGGSTIQAPYKERFDRLISHAHGQNQIAISTADIDLAAFRRKVIKYKAIKTRPAGINR